MLIRGYVESFIRPAHRQEAYYIRWAQQPHKQKTLTEKFPLKRTSSEEMPGFSTFNETDKISFKNFSATRTGYRFRTSILNIVIVLFGYPATRATHRVSPPAASIDEYWRKEKNHPECTATQPDVCTRLGHKCVEYKWRCFDAHHVQGSAF